MFLRFSGKKSQKSARYCWSNLRNILTFWGKEGRGQALPQNAPIILRTILTFLPENIVCFYSAQKVNFPSNCVSIFPLIAHIISITLWTFLPDNLEGFDPWTAQKWCFSQIVPTISSNILTFLPNNPVCFYNKNSQKVNFSSNYANNTVHFIDFSPKESDLFLKMRMHIKHYFDFFAR